MHPSYRDRGSISLELALAMPVLILLTVSSLFLGIIYANRAALQDAATEGARTASYYGGDYAEVSQDVADTVRQRFAGDAASVQVTVSFTDEDGQPYERTYAVGEGDPGAPGVPAAPGTRISVRVFFPDYAVVLPFVPDSQIELAGTAVTRNAVP